MKFLPRDFIETQEGLIFAVLTSAIEEGRVLAFLRYHRSDADKKRKLNTKQANDLLAEQFPQYLFHSHQLDAHLHAVPVEQIIQHYQPREKLQQLIIGNDADPLIKKLKDLVLLFDQNGIVTSDLGVTGSFLISQQNSGSDIDLVLYDREKFQQMRNVIKQLITEQSLKELDKHFWQESFTRRDCDLTLEEYIWHEKRKFNKAIFENIKFDISLNVEAAKDKNRYTKQGETVIRTEVINADYAFDTPAIYHLSHEKYKQLFCFTPTYSGQAVAGEPVEISGLIEQSEEGKQRIIIGSSREAPGEYLKVIKN